MEVLYTGGMSQVIADLQLHSKYSRAVSKNMVIPVMAEWGRRKGIDLLATGDWMHSLWMVELQSQLQEVSPGIFVYGTEKTKFLLSTEISSIYTQGGRVRRVHTLVFAPNFTVARKINNELLGRGCNLSSDGRPIVGLSCRQLAEIVLGVDEKCLLIPAHCWTPWFSLYGSKGGFDSIEECFGEFSNQVYAVETGLSCYDEETEVLTETGWRRISEVRRTNKVCTLNIDTQNVEFQSPTGTFTYDYKGKMYRLKTKRVDLLVTPNHKLLVSHCDFRKSPDFQLKEAQFLFNKSKRFKKNGVWRGKNERYFVLPAVEMRHGSRYYSGFRVKKEKRFPMKSWLKFLGFWIAEGWVTQGKDGDYNVCLANRDKGLLNEMKQILESFGYDVYQGKDLIRVRDYQLFYHLKQFGKSFDKFIPEDIKFLSKNLLEILLKYYIKGDGHIYGRTGKGLSATTNSVRLRDDLQEIALKIGISAYYRLVSKKGSPTLLLGPYKQSHDIWVVYFIRKNIHTVLPSTVRRHNYIESWVDFEGSVFCVAVPNKVIYVRRNGIPVWCGNSDPAMNWRIEELERRAIVSFSDAHSPAKLGREATVFRGDDNFTYDDVYGAIAERYVGKNEGKLKIDYTVEFYPEEGKYHYTGHRKCEVKQEGTMCPVCDRPLTRGVLSRVQELAGSEVEAVKKINQQGVMFNYHPTDETRLPYAMMVPLQEILAQVYGVGVGAKQVVEEYQRLTDYFGGEFKILLATGLDKVRAAGGDRLAEAIDRVRRQEISIDPGYDGEYGKVEIWSDEPPFAKASGGEQISLF